MSRERRPFLIVEDLRPTVSDVCGAATVQSLAYITAYESSDLATEGGITNFVHISDFMERKARYYEEHASTRVATKQALIARYAGSCSVLGVCVVLQDATDLAQAYVDALFVHPAHQGEGIGSALLTSALVHLSGWKVVQAETTLDTGAVRFFEKHGFKTDGIVRSYPPQPYDWSELMLFQKRMKATREQYFNAESQSHPG